MNQERYERMVAKYGVDDPGTKNAKRQLDEKTAAASGQMAMEADKREQGLVVDQTRLKKDEESTTNAGKPKVDPTTDA